jgi:peroxiredoxin
MNNSKFWTLFLLGVGLACGCVSGLVVALVSAGFSISNWQPQAEKSPATNPRIGQLAPDFELTNLAEETVHLSELRGQPVVLNFWATWCGPCAEEMPIFQKYVETYPEMQLIAVNAGESLAKVQKFINSNEYTFNILMDPGEKVNWAYRITALPATYFLDGEGRIVAVQIGSMTEKQFQKYLKQIGIPQE